MDKRGLKQLEVIFSGIDQVLAAAGGALRLVDVVVLECLRERGRMNAGAIAQALSLSSAKVTRCTTRLEQLSLISGLPDKTDLRKRVFRLTNRGENVAFEIARAYGQLRAERMVVRFSRVNQAARDVAQELSCGKLSASAMRILIALGMEQGAASVARVQKTAGIAQSKASMSLSALRDRGLVVADEPGTDARAHRYRLTDEGAYAASRLTEALLSVPAR